MEEGDQELPSKGMCSMKRVMRRGWCRVSSAKRGSSSTLYGITTVFVFTEIRARVAVAAAAAA
eukprot:CAMPEP_0174908162 /NCGR_PEP_ID=MMETSP0167-20121228/63723_1 /TAXON_ID=38298 /ORGANISM="Rhodella maculata, Strain CCMP736" /LENGTH=62 /DNA_ID=CAMNT_0016151849 /DNA_START=126 /DNA_END=310 /DNA_ORIENTATION=-